MRLSLSARRDLYCNQKNAMSLRRRIGLIKSEIDYYKNKHKNVNAECTWRELPERLALMLLKKDYFMIPQVDFVVTTKCSLKCKYCANLMQYYQHPYDVDMDVLKQSLEKFLGAVDYVRTVLVLGGEPFVRRELEVIIHMLADSKKVGEVLVVTNGTICPKDEALIRALKRKKVVIRLSDYKELSRNKRKLINLCNREKIAYRVEKQDRWYDLGSVQSRNRNKKEMQIQFDRCATLCRSILNGKMYYCAHAAHLADLGYVSAEKDCVDLLKEKPQEKLRAELIQFTCRRKYIEGCDRCDVRSPGYEENKIKPAVQTREVLTE